MNINKTPILKSYLESLNIQDISESLYHATTKSRARNIIKQGFNTEKCGDNFHDYEIRPNIMSTYFSTFPMSSNLPCSLFESNEEVFVIEISSKAIKEDQIYPDDSFFAAIAQEEIFETIEDIMTEFPEIPLEEAEYIYNCTWELTPENAHEWKSFAKWFLKRDGEISTTMNIDSKFITGHYKHANSPQIQSEPALS